MLVSRLIGRYARLALLVPYVFCGKAHADASLVTLDSSLRLKVYIRGAAGEQDRLIGKTPAPKQHPLRIKRGDFIYVRPLDELTPARLQALAAFVQHHGIAGLDVSGHAELTDGRLAPLRALRQLRYLDLSETATTDRLLQTLAPLTRLAVIV